MHEEEKNVVFEESKYHECFPYSYSPYGPIPNMEKERLTQQQAEELTKSVIPESQNYLG